MKKIIIAILAIAITAVGAIFALGQTEKKEMEAKRGYAHHGKFAKRGAMKGNRMFRHLDLTDSQKEQMKAIRQASRENTKELRQASREIRKQLDALGTDGQLDVALLDQLAGQQAELQKQLIIERHKTKAQIFALLTPDQKAKADEMKARSAERRNKRMEFRKSRTDENKADQ